MAASLQLDRSAQRPQDPLRRPTARLTHQSNGPGLTHRKSDTLQECFPTPWNRQTTDGRPGPDSTSAALGATRLPDPLNDLPTRFTACRLQQHLQKAIKTLVVCNASRTPRFARKLSRLWLHRAKARRRMLIAACSLTTTVNFCVPLFAVSLLARVRTRSATSKLWPVCVPPRCINIERARRTHARRPPAGYSGVLDYS